MKLEFPTFRAWRDRALGRREAGDDDRIHRIPVDRIHQNPYQPRKVFVDEELEELQGSIREYGVIVPIIVRAIESGYELVCGERRLRASRLLGLPTIPAIIRKLSTPEILEVAFLENLQRVDFNPVEEAETYERLRQEFSRLTREELGHKIGKSPDRITERLWILELAPVLRQALLTRMITEDHARLLKAIRDEERLLPLIERVFRGKASSGELQRLLAAESAPAPGAPSVPLPSGEAPPPPPRVPDFDAPLLADVRRLLGSFTGNGAPDMALADALVRSLLGGLDEDPALVLDLSLASRDIGAPPDFATGHLPRHVLNVAKLALHLGRHHGLDANALTALGRAAILHDLGMRNLPASLVGKPGRLDAAEAGILHRHPAEGAALLARLKLLDPELTRAVSEEHERADGSGYPMGLKGPDIHVFAKIIGIADTYEALVSPRPHRGAMLPRKAMELLVFAAHHGRFEKPFIRSFLRGMSLFPLGSFVRLSTGETGRVVAANPDDITRPVVRILRDAGGTAPAAPVVRDLLRETAVSVTAAMRSA
ncbi:MAG: ParB/RepB/Spo0J family partition protein [Planctomycetota bacterium]